MTPDDLSMRARIRDRFRKSLETYMPNGEPCRYPWQMHRDTTRSELLNELVAAVEELGILPRQFVAPKATESTTIALEDCLVLGLVEWTPAGLAYLEKKGFCEQPGQPTKANSSKKVNVHSARVVDKVNDIWYCEEQGWVPYHGATLPYHTISGPELEEIRSKWEKDHAK